MAQPTPPAPTALETHPMGWGTKPSAATKPPPLGTSWSRPYRHVAVVLAAGELAEQEPVEWLGHFDRHGVEGDGDGAVVAKRELFGGSSGRSGTVVGRRAG